MNDDLKYTSEDKSVRRSHSLKPKDQYHIKKSDKMAIFKSVAAGTSMFET